MPIDAKSVKWDVPDEKSVKWDDHKPENAGTLANIGMGALSGAAKIGSTLLAPIRRPLNAGLEAAGLQPISRETNDQFFKQNADPESIAFKGGELGSEIAGTAGAGGVLAKGASLIPQLAKFAPVIESGGFNLGKAATNSVAANAAMRSAGGALQGAAASGLVDPSTVGQGAVIGAVAPGAIQVAGKAGDLVSQGLESAAQKLMTSAIKPTIKQHGKGEAARAVQTLLDEGISPTKAGIGRLQQRVDDINSQVDNLIQGSNATVDQAKVAAALSSPRGKFGMQVDPSADLSAIDAVEAGFMNNPMIGGNPAIPVQLAQELKKGTYRVLNGKYGEMGNASTEAQKALARGLKEEIEAVVPQVGPLNAQERELLNALEVAQRRVLMNANNNPIGLTPAMGGSLGKLAFLLDRSVAAKALAARGAHQLAQNNPVGNMPNLLGSGLYGVPSVVATSP